MTPVDWNYVVNRALSNPQRGPGRNLPRPIMLKDFAVYVGCHFDNFSPMNPSGHPLWHVSMNMHSNARYRVQEWAAGWIAASERIAEEIFERPTGRDAYLVLPSKGIVLNLGRRMTDLEIENARPYLPNILLV